MSYLLWILGGFGVLGLHRFYLWRWVTGLIWLLTGGLLGIGAIIDLFVIPPMVQVENLSRQLLSQAQGKKPQINTDGHGWTERGGKRESGVRGPEFGDLKPQASSLKPQAFLHHRWTHIKRAPRGSAGLAGLVTTRLVCDEPYGLKCSRRGSAERIWRPRGHRHRR